MVDFVAPDQYIDLSQYRGSAIDFNKEARLLCAALDASCKENDIQRYIKNNQKWFIPGSLLRDYDFGHHGAYLVSEQPLGAEYRADYMLLGRNSLGYHVVLVEFEDVNTEYNMKNENTERVSVRKGLTQIRDWKRWIDDNRQYFLESSGLSSIKENIPSWGFNYCLVVSRRRLLNDAANQMRRQQQEEMHQLRIVTYDRLVDNVELLVNGF